MRSQGLSDRGRAPCLPPALAPYVCVHRNTASASLTHTQITNMHTVQHARLHVCACTKGRHTVTERYTY